MKKYLILFLVLALLVIGALSIFYSSQVSVRGSASSVEKVQYVRASENDIVVASPKPGETSGSIVTVSGRARGTWYFEASFPVVVLNAQGGVVGQSAATANGDWMTEDFVPFTATITLTTPYTGPATLVLKKDNPSGEKSRDASLSIPIVLQ